MDSYIRAETKSQAGPLVDETLSEVPLPRWQLGRGDSESGARTVVPQGPPTSVFERQRPEPGAPPVSTEPQQGYRMIKRVGAGGMGEVWAALQSTLERPVAVKMMLSARETGAAAAAEFRLEAMVAGRLEHPNIVPIHDLGMDGQGRPLIAMKLVEGKNWNELILDDIDAMNEHDFLGKHLPILVSMTHAVAFAHDRGVVHRDLKPSQVMVGLFGETLLMDWGMAIAWKDTQRGHAPALELPMPDRAVNPAGTPAMMAPEQTHASARSVGPHTDVFLLGGTLYFLLTGTYPYQAPTSLAAFMKATEIELESPKERAPSRWIPAELATIAMKAMAPEIEHRYADAEQFRNAVTDWMTGAADRREAHALLYEADAALDARPSTYDAFDDVLRRIDRARTLWPDQPGSDELGSRAREGYARLALEARDLTLARAHAGGISITKKKLALIREIDAAALDAKRRDAQRRWAIVGVFGLLVAMLLSSSVFIYRLDRARLAALAANRETERQRNRAERARGDSEELIAFMVRDLTNRLDPVGRLDIMEVVLQKLDGVLQRRQSEGMTSSERRSMSDLLVLVSDVRRDQGNLSAAELTIARAKQLADASMAAHPHDTQSKEDMADVMTTLGDISVAKGEVDAAAAQFDRALQLCKEIAAAEPNSVEAKINLAATFSRVGDVRRGMGDLPAAAEAFEESLKIHRALELDDPKNSSVQRALVVSLNNFGSVLSAQGNIDAAQETLHQALEKAEGLEESEPNNATWKEIKAETLSMLGTILTSRGNIVYARMYYEDYLATSRLLTETDPSNMHWQKQLGSALLRVGGVQLSQGDLEPVWIPESA